jgi:hypothetical protein
MNYRLLIPTAALALAMLAPTVRAELILSGETTGSFEDLGQPNTTVTNDSSTDTAFWESGIPFPPTTLPTSILFQGQTFVDVVSGEPIDVGLFTIHNGIDLAGSTAPAALFDLGLSLTSPVIDAFGLTTFSFNIDNTLNDPTLLPDQYSVTFNQPPLMYIDNNLVRFTVVFSPPVVTVPEGGTTTRGDVFVTFTPVPEPSTYALWGVLLVAGIVAYGRFRKGDQVRV